MELAMRVLIKLDTPSGASNPTPTTVPTEPPHVPLSNDKHVNSTVATNSPPTSMTNLMFVFIRAPYRFIIFSICIGISVGAAVLMNWKAIANRLINASIVFCAVITALISLVILADSMYLQGAEWFKHQFNSSINPLWLVGSHSIPSWWTILPVISPLLVIWLLPKTTVGHNWPFKHASTGDDTPKMTGSTESSNAGTGTHQFGGRPGQHRRREHQTDLNNLENIRVANHQFDKTKY